MGNRQSVTLAEPIIYSKGQHKFEVLWKTFENFILPVWTPGSQIAEILGHAGF